jgi:hypothetical protein
MRGMRKRYRVLIFAALAAALIVPVGYALSIDSTPATTRAGHAVVPAAAVSAVAAPVMMHRMKETEAAPMLSPLNEAAKLIVVGTILFGLAAAVRKAH